MANERGLAVSGPAILAWLVECHMAWREQGLDPPQVVIDGTAALRVDMDPLCDFLEQCCAFGAKLRCSRSALRSVGELNIRRR